VGVRGTDVTAAQHALQPTRGIGAIMYVEYVPYGSGGLAGRSARG
jgi:hypothetical protein